MNKQSGNCEPPGYNALAAPHVCHMYNLLKMPGQILVSSVFVAFLLRKGVLLCKKEERMSLNLTFVKVDKNRKDM